MGTRDRRERGTVSEYYISLGLFARLSAIRQRAPRNSFDNNFHGRDEVPESGNLKKYNIDSNCAIIMYLVKMRMPRINLILLEIIWLQLQRNYREIVARLHSCGVSREFLLISEHLSNRKETYD